MNKKLLSLILAVAMLFSVMAPVVKATPGDDVPAERKATYVMTKGEALDVAEIVFEPEIDSSFSVDGIVNEAHESVDVATLDAGEFTKLFVAVFIDMDTELTYIPLTLTVNPDPKDKTIEELQASIEDLNKKLEEKETELATTQGDKEALAKEVAELKEQIKKLTEELNKKEPVVVNKMFLERVIKTLKEIRREDLVKESQKIYDEALVLATSVLGNANATQEQVDEAASKVLDAIYGVELIDTVADVKDLKEILAHAKKADSRDFRRRDYEDLQKMIRDAEKLLANRRTPQKDIDAAYQEISDLLIYVIEDKNDMKELRELIEKAEKVDKEKLTRRERYAFEDALKKAKELLWDTSATQRTIDRAYDALKATVKDLAETTKDETVKDLVNDMLDKESDVDAEKALLKIRGLFATAPGMNIPLVETKPLDLTAKVEQLKYVLTINSKRFAEVTNREINVYEMDSAPFASNGRTMVPLRFAAYMLGADVTWDQFTKTAVFSMNGKTARVTLGSNLVLTSDGQNFNMDQAPIVRNNRLHVSISNIARIFGFTSGYLNDGNDNKIDWDADNKAVIIYVAK